jgi:hypothetical protein
VLAPKEIESAQRQLDVRTFKQEYEGSFEKIGGIVYYSYSIENNKYIEFEQNRDTYLLFDFNVNPMTCIINQNIGNGEYCTVKEFVHRNSNTESTSLAVDEYLKKNNFQGSLEVTGDATGFSQKSSATSSDYQIIENIFKNYKNYQRKTKRSSIRNRVNALNSLLKNAKGEIRQYINPDKCPYLVKDLQRQEWKDNNIELDDKGGKIGHRTDALSYFALNYFPIETQTEISYR